MRLKFDFYNYITDGTDCMNSGVKIGMLEMTR